MDATLNNKLTEADLDAQIQASRESVDEDSEPWRYSGYDEAGDLTQPAGNGLQRLVGWALLTIVVGVVLLAAFMPPAQP